MEQTRNMKMTPVGFIPEDWVVATIKDFGHLLSDGINPQQYRDKDFVEYSMPAYDDGQSPTKCKGADMNSNRTQIKGEVLLFNKLNVRQKRVWYIANAPSNALCSMEFLAFSSNKVDLRLLREILLQDSVTKGFESVSRGTSNSQKRIAPSDFLNFSFALPPLEEQHRIADALAGVDDLIGALDEEIAKKRQIKEGLMQQLLTGKTRLSGFDSPWKQVRLGDVSSICTGKRNGDEQKESGLYPFFVRSQTVYRIDTYSYDGEAIIVPGEGGIGKIFHYINGKFDYHQRVYKISDFINEIDVKFIYYYMKFFFGPYALMNTVKATVDSLRLPTFLDFIMTIPESKEEQIRIAAIFTNADNELLALEKERDKYLLIKQGMMQELLTGKTRLV